MLKRFVFLVCGCLFLAQPGMALIDGQLLVGQKSGKVKDDGTSTDLSGSEIKVAVHVDPIPLVPVAFGGYLISDTLELGDANLSTTGAEFGLEVMAWVPIGIAGLKPYGKLGYTIVGAYKIEDFISTTDGNGNAVSADVAYKATGTHLALGLKWSPLPLIGVMLEYDISTVEFDLDEVDSIAGVTIDTSGVSTPKYESTTILLGVEVGI